MPRPRVTIHLHASEQIGTGHLFRMLWLARRLRQQGVTVEMLLRGKAAVAASIRRWGIAVQAYPDAVPMRQAVTRYLLGLRRRPSVWVNDCLTVPRTVNVAIQRHRIPIVTLDDLARGLSSEDCVVNAQPSFWHTVRLTTPAQVCQGPRYKVLHPAVQQYHDRPKRLARRRRYHVAVTFGGTDQHGLLFEVLRAMRRVQHPVQWHLFLGPMFAHRRRLGAWRRRLAGGAVRVRWHDGSWNVIPLFARMDAAICSCGLTIFEMMGVGTPALAVANAPHEAHNGRYFASEGGCQFLGLHRRVTARAIADALDDLLEDGARRAAMSRRGKALVDGRGLERVTELIMERLSAPAPRCARARNGAAHLVGAST
ncbi:MAG: hypothetical protein HY597_00995 [Candidatus Omnitrophica bacterium]|nr:hypothetical protein [Candidatus Omnitrophota bacterium]